MLVATFWLAFVVATPAVVAWSATGGAAAGDGRGSSSATARRASRSRTAGSGPAAPGSPASSSAAPSRWTRGDPPGRRPRGRRPRLPAAAPLPEARGAGGRPRRPRPGAVLAGQHPRPRAPRGRRHLGADPPSGLTGAPRGSLRAWLTPAPASSGPSSRSSPPLGAAALAKKALDTGWKAATGKHPPENPADPDVAMGEAVAWAVVSGTFVGAGADARPAPGRGLLPPVGRPPAARSSRRTDAGRAGAPTCRRRARTEAADSGRDVGPRLAGRRGRLRVLAASSVACSGAVAADQLLRVRELAAVVHQEAAHAGELVLLAWASPRPPAPRARGRRRAARRTRRPRPRPRRPCRSSCRADAP